MKAPKNDHRLARAICSSLNIKEPVYFHAGGTTDLVLGGGCPRCNEYLRMLAGARIDGVTQALVFCESEREIHLDAAKKSQEPDSLFSLAAAEGVRGCVKLIEALMIRLELEAKP